MSETVAQCPHCMRRFAGTDDVLRHLYTLHSAVSELDTQLQAARREIFLLTTPEQRHGEPSNGSWGRGGLE